MGGISPVSGGNADLPPLPTTSEKKVLEDKVSWVAGKVSSSRAEASPSKEVFDSVTRAAGGGIVKHTSRVVSSMVLSGAKKAQDSIPSLGGHRITNGPKEKRSERT